MSIFSCVIHNISQNTNQGKNSKLISETNEADVVEKSEN